LNMKPPRLQPGDTVAIISPSNTMALQPERAERARLNLEQATGLNVIFAPNAMAKHYYSAGTPQQRTDDFHWALKNPAIKGILFSGGGHSAIDLVEELDYELIKQRPKIIAGISDACTLLDPIYTKTGLITYHGFEFFDFADRDMSYTVNSIKEMWMSDEIIEFKPNPNWKDLNGTFTTYTGWETIRGGSASGRLIGGNFGCFVQLRGTEYFPESFEGIILVMETYKWDKRQLHRGLMQLKIWGILDQISGLIVGYCVDSDRQKIIGNDQTMKELVLEVVKDYDFPVMQIGEIGHNVENLILPIGAEAFIDTEKKIFKLT
jgi:muramoyltetrapeptide carboxypeptidase